MKRITFAAASLIAVAAYAGPSTIDISQYGLVGRYALPHSTNMTLPPGGNLLADEASGVAYNKDTGNLFLVGDGGRSVTEVSKTGSFVSTMTMAPGSSPQGTYYYDPEGITYVGGGKFVFVEERYRIAHLFTYDSTKTLGSDVFTQSFKMGTNASNVGLEGLSYDPATNGYIFAKEKTPMGVFQSTIDFVNGTASNGSPTTVDSVNLFDPNTLGITDTADVFALSNIDSLVGGVNYNDILVLSQESGKIVQVDRSGNIKGVLLITNQSGDLPVIDQQHEGLVMDSDGILYVVNENGGGNTIPQLWVYAPIPEPSTYAALLGAAGLLLALRRRATA